MSTHVIRKIGLALFTLFALVSIAAMIYNYRLIGHFLPINADHNVFYHRPVVDDPNLQRPSCHVSPPLPRTKRTEFGRRGCTIYGYPSTGGVLIKEADLLDMLFLSLPRSHELQRTCDVDEEDRFCHLLRRTGAKWWSSREDEIDAMLGERHMTEEEEKVIVFGWPTDGVGVWVLRYQSGWQRPKDFGRMSLAMSMEEKIKIMREYGATFVEDVTQVEELYNDQIPSKGTFGEEL
ncbi:hypothetical protein N7509_003697 [Penicillium cosmopolitanum]|uniref:Uncharacterized protein n=1 Tax=Penicillium cosmopolitanum TaxID=1131564 RepID=A0A9X0BBL6_9EURO|nr:uncharacterized protein N7509_003697 [Penicillium cosmopolitanum]KAJ5403826.1 hypothetical protein N7509_003697 [Penicillium cosmopolitanum]